MFGLYKRKHKPSQHEVVLCVAGLELTKDHDSEAILMAVLSVTTAILVAGNQALLVLLEEVCLNHRLVRPVVVFKTAS